MDGHQYEHKCAQYLREQGYADVIVTRGSGDQGVDITAMKGGKKYAIQCKYYEGNVGNKAIQEVYAGAAFYNCSVAMVITNSTFTKSAKELAQKLKVILVENINAIKLMESNLSVKSKAVPTPGRKERSIEEQLEDQYQDMVKRFPGNPKLDSEISKYVQEKQVLINDMVSQYQKEHSKVSNRGSVLLIRATSGYVNRDEDPRIQLLKQLMVRMQKEIDEIDDYGRNCLKAGISDSSAKMLIDIIVKTAKLGKSIVNEYDPHYSYYDSPQYDSTWELLRNNLPSELEGPAAQPIRKQIDHQKELVCIQLEQIQALEQTIAGRASMLVSLEEELIQQKIEADSYRQKLAANNAAQSVELTPLDEQLETINKKIQQTAEKKDRLEQERKSLSLLSFKQKSTLREQIDKCNTEIDAFNAEAQSYAQQKNSIVSKYSQLDEELQSAINAAESKQQQMDDQICQLKLDIREHISEKRLEKANKELQTYRNTIQSMENSIKNTRIAYMVTKFGPGSKFHITNYDMDKLIQRRSKCMTRG